MYEETILKEIKIENKLISGVFILFAILLIQNKWYLLTISIVAAYLNWIGRKGKLLSIATLLAAIGTIINPQLLWITKLGIAAIYILLLIKTIFFSNWIELIEETVYKMGNRKWTMRVLRLSYWQKEMKYYLQIWKEKQGKEKKQIKQMIEGFVQSGRLARNKTNQILLTYQLRFYNQYRERTNVEESNWEIWDTNYFLFHLAILIISMILGR